VHRCNRKNFEPILGLAIRDRPLRRRRSSIGTLFTFGDAEAVLEHSRLLISIRSPAIAMKKDIS
jgi:hypothetical protein